MKKTTVPNTRNTVTITIDRFEKLVRDSQKLAALAGFIKNATYSSDIKKMLEALEGGNENESV